MSDVLKARIKQRRFRNPAHEAMLNLMVAAAHVRQMVEEACVDHDLTQAQYNVLRILRGKHPDGYPRGEVASRMIDRAPDVTRLIDRLERRGLVERVRSTEDRRLSITRITRKGLAVLTKLDPRIEALDAQFSSRLPPRDLKTLSQLCERVYELDIAHEAAALRAPR